MMVVAVVHVCMCMCVYVHMCFCVHDVYRLVQLYAIVFTHVHMCLAHVCAHVHA